ncbi:MSC_0882 family membrane protein [Mycoplasmopsis verecunda]|uniref:Uncharacterized protein n=1 Tax=Mycoplasmopsis verecunda TaxID=171291 RepID=A0A1T4LU49_9BACT|nr:hypothetical protein [Mycoplasmopsis verecunda]WPB54560.1 hypothetical protein SAM46_00100 [Mycoplasmopsis verecunda]SJZ58058.1 hypothetical protein SAMN02745154_00537 [Mycoplasmopsis verecunda]
MFNVPNNGDLQQVTTPVPNTLEVTTETKVKKDPLKIIPDAINTTLQREKTLNLIQFLFWFIIFLASIAGILTNYFLNTAVDKNKGIGWYVLLSFVFLLSLSLFAKALTKQKSWRHAISMCRENYSHGNIAAVTVIPDTYRAIRLKILRYTWLFAFFITYFALFNGVLLFLLNVWDGVWNIEVNNPNLKFNINIHWKEVLDNAFGNVYVLLWVDFGVALGFTAIYVLALMYDRKRYTEVATLLGADAATIKNAVNAEIKSENKAWIKAYIIIFIIVVLLPIALLCYLVWRGIIKRGKK